MQAVYPVRVELKGLSRAAAARSAVTRISPTGTESDMQNRFAGSGNEWGEPNQYFAGIRVYLSELARHQLSSVVIDLGRKRIETEHPAVSSLWKAVSQPRTQIPEDLEPLVDPAAVAYEFTPPSEFSSPSVLPVISGAFNYLGDIRLSLWSLLWAFLVVFPTVFALWLRGTGESKGVGLTVLQAATILIVAGTTLRFIDPARAFAVNLGFFEVVPAALSISLIVFIIASAPMNAHRPLTPSRFVSPYRHEALVVMLIMVLGLVLRVVDLDAIMRSDMYNLAAGFSLHETGEYSYGRNRDLTHMVAALSDVFGPSVAGSKIPFIIAGTITIPLAYVIGKRVSPYVGALTALLFALGPNHIAVAGHVREYSINLLIGTAITAVQFLLYRQYSHRRNAFLPLLFGFSALMFGAVYVYSLNVGNVTVPAVIQSGSFVLIAFTLHFIAHQVPKLLKPLLVATAVAFIFGLAVIHNFGPFTRGFVFESDFYLSYLNPLADKTMQTFSLAAVSPAFVIGLLILPHFSRRRSPYYDAALLAFWGTFLLYSFKLEAGGSDRYLYHVTIFYALLLTGGLLWLVRGIASRISSSRTKWLFVAFIVAVMVNPVNTVQSALGAVPSSADPRRPSGSSGGDYYRQLADFMTEQGVSRNSAVVDATGRPYLTSLVLERPFTSQWESTLGRTYDVGDNVYVIRMSKHETDQSDQALREHESGFLVTDKYHLVPPNDFRFGDISFAYLGSVDDLYRAGSGFLLHQWKAKGPDAFAFGPLFTPSNELLPGLYRDDLFNP